MTEAASENTSSATAARDARGRFQVGCSGNPAGKRPGTLNRATIVKRIMADGDEERIASLIVERALEGEWGALRFVQDRLEPKPRARPIMLDFPENATVAEMAEIVLRATAAGEISPEEALQMMRLLDKVEGQRCAAWASAAVHGHAAPATRPTVARRPADPPEEAEPDLHSASIAAPPAAAAEPAAVLQSTSNAASPASVPDATAPRVAAPGGPPAAATRRRRAAAAAPGSLPLVAALAAGAVGPAEGLQSACNLQP